MLPIAAALRVFRAVPVWAWALAALLAWGAWQKHRAAAAGAELLEQRAAIAQQREQALQASIEKGAQRVADQQEITRHANQAAAAAQGDAARARAAAARVRAQAAADAARARAADPASRQQCEAAAAAAVLYADLLGRAVDRNVELADFADRASIAGEACQRAYDTLRK